MNDGSSRGAGQWLSPLLHAGGAALAGGLALGVQAGGGNIFASSGVLLLGIAIVVILSRRLALTRSASA